MIVIKIVVRRMSLRVNFEVRKISIEKLACPDRSRYNFRFPLCYNLKPLELTLYFRFSCSLLFQYVTSSVFQISRANLKKCIEKLACSKGFSIQNLFQGFTRTDSAFYGFDYNGLLCRMSLRVNLDARKISIGKPCVSQSFSIQFQVDAALQPKTTRTDTSFQVFLPLIFLVCHFECFLDEHRESKKCIEKLACSKGFSIQNLFQGFTRTDTLFQVFLLLTFLVCHFECFLDEYSES